MLWCQKNPREAPLPYHLKDKKNPKTFFIKKFSLLREKWMRRNRKWKMRKRKQKGTCVIDSMKWTKEKGWVCVLETKVWCKDRYLNSIGILNLSFGLVEKMGFVRQPHVRVFSYLPFLKKQTRPSQIYMFFFPFAWAYTLCVPRWKRTKVRK